MKICFFGTYDRTYSSNRLILQGLKENNIPVLEINAHIKVTELNTKSEMSWFHIVRRILRKYRIFSETIKNINELKKCDVIYVGYPGHVDVFFAYIAAKIFNKKLVFNPMLTIYIGFTEETVLLGKKSILGQVIKLGEKFAYNLSDIVFADTPYQKKLLEKIFRIPSKKLKVLPIGADNNGYEYSEYKNKSNKINIVYYGLYSSIHGVEHLIEAANILRDDNDITFTLVGKGREYASNYKRAQDLKLKNVVFYPDILEGQHLEYLQKADVFLGLLQKHPSVDRIIPNKVYQGLALGRAVLTADSPVIRSVFNNKENIYLCNQADQQSLVEAIKKLKNDPELRSKIAKNGYKLYVKDFSPVAVVRKLADYIEEIL